jgi:Ca2+-transporting ATPase
VFEIGLFSNRWLVLSVAISFLISLPLLYVPFLQGVFNTYPLSGQDWLIVILSSLTIFPVLEAGKVIARRFHKGASRHNNLTAGQN